MDTRGVKRFFKYSLIGSGTFLFDLALLFLFIDVFLMNSIVAAGVAFLIAVSINYIISRRLVFKGTRRNYHSGYGYFILIVGVGFIFVTGGMYLMVSVFGFHYLISRVVISVFTGIWNYLMNLYYNFKMVGRYEQ